jgi:hypothetical protein
LTKREADIAIQPIEERSRESGGERVGQAGAALGHLIQIPMDHELGAPRYLVSPNKIHHLFWAQWQNVYKDALSFSPPGFHLKRHDLSFDGELGDHPHPGWARDIDQIVFRGNRIFESLKFRLVGGFRSVGLKFGRWVDTVLM